MEKEMNKKKEVKQSSQLEGGQGDLEPEPKKTTRRTVKKGERTSKGQFKKGVPQSQGERSDAPERTSKGQFKKGVPQGQGDWSCHFVNCDHQFKHQSSLYRHLSNIHNVNLESEEKFPGRRRICPFGCRQHFSFRNKMVNHLINTHKIEEPEANNLCDQAQEVFPMEFSEAKKNVPCVMMQNSNCPKD